MKKKKAGMGLRANDQTARTGMSAPVGLKIGQDAGVQVANLRHQPAASTGDKDEDRAPEGRDPGSAAKESTNPYDSCSDEE